MQVSHDEKDDLIDCKSNTPPSGRNEKERKKESSKRSGNTQNVTMANKDNKRERFHKDISRHICGGNPCSSKWTVLYMGAEKFALFEQWKMSDSVNLKKYDNKSSDPI